MGSWGVGFAQHGGDLFHLWVRTNVWLGNKRKVLFLRIIYRIGGAAPAGVRLLTGGFTFTSTCKG